LLERWNGTSWRIEVTPGPAGVNAFADVSCASASSCMVVGSSGSQPNVKPFAEHWNGSSWAIASPSFGASLPFAALSSVACSSASSCVVVGTAFTNDTTAVAAGWDGHSWHAERTAVPPDEDVIGSQRSDEFFGVSCAAASACVAVGDYNSTEETRPSLGEGWNGLKWTVEPTKSKSGYSPLNDIACSAPRTCTAVGAAYPANKASTFIERSN
jgi:hypothetical protein